MSARLKLVSTGALSLHADWIWPIVSEWVDTVPYDPARTYGAGHCLYTDTFDHVAQQWLESARPVVIDRLWENDQDHAGCFVLKNPAWFWYNESLWYQHLGYDQYKPEPAWTHRALMPMRRKRTHRDQLIDLLKTNLDQFVWSYQSLGRNLPRDQDPAQDSSQRYFDPGWYDATAFSLVAETDMISQRASQPFVTEKTFKPMAFWHPFLIAGNAHTLAYLHELGFETFENVFDESYDLLTNWQSRCRAVVATALAFDMQPHSPLTKQKLAHNHDRFFDRQLVTQRMKQELLEPLIQYANT